MMSPDILAVAALAVSALVVGVVVLAVWLWYSYGAHRGEPRT